MAGTQRVPANFQGDATDNFEEIEKQFAVKAVQHLETYWAILEKVKASTLRLTKIDNDIYEHLLKDFPEFDPAEPLNEDKMKSPEGKKRWRDFMMAYENKVDDYSFGTILRKDPKEEYTEHGTIFVPRMQFYAVEIARNRKGLNDWIYEKAQAEAAGKK
ncbi:hypothetical protein M406DRAFT_53381 [Cryphonectria parasitica EP155]|uniref:Protein PBDC1 homolog n=1 Tax=Cryphonectria parasitica (strain ATCC 38755 / EP155) TaxID=660469 RepID=A0A9P4XVI8_CRYP1|nr:uncharacterized protein M406DRAFT_53381 [Cryphonectria parasitica EP155]KAF3762069.1 hypothetical protein M406DRAFT_53381 [Cryphonectria parasitica EP155]